MSTTPLHRQNAAMEGLLGTLEEVHAATIASQAAPGKRIQVDQGNAFESAPLVPPSIGGDPGKAGFERPVGREGSVNPENPGRNVVGVKDFKAMVFTFH